ncbi:unnamed protein product, partial [Ectocarpus sp. 8 AP-2014]
QVAPGSRGTGAGRDAVPPLAWWDAGRCMVHGKFDATVFGAVAMLVANAQCTPPSARLPSRETLAAAATAGNIPKAPATTAPGGGRPADQSGTVPGSGTASPGSSSLPTSSGHRPSWKGGRVWRRDRRGSGSGGGGGGGGVDEGDSIG